MTRQANAFFLLCVLCVLHLQSADGRRVIRAAKDEPKTGNFVVRLNQSLSHEEFKEVEKEIEINGEGSPVYEEDNDLIKVVTIRINESMLEEVKHIKGVEYLEEETYAHGMQISLPYHLDRVDEDCTHSTLDGYFQPIGDGEGVDIYVLDSGIHYSHDDFDGRAKYSGKDPIDEYNGENQKGLDCNGHGTHCASLAAGKAVGVAKKANLYSVRVLGCNNFGPWSAIISGLNHVVKKAEETNRPTIVSMSLGGSYFQTMDNLVTEVVKKGITVVVAAGNDGHDACGNSPASNPNAITVGASRQGRKMYYFTNGGRCVDIIAPGQNVYGASRTCNTCYEYLTGTSMATPIVAGAAAIHLQRKPKLSPAAVAKILLDDACVGKLDFTDLAENLHSTTPNKLLHLTGSCGGIYSVGSTGSKQITSPNYGDYPGDLECVYKLVTDRGRVIRLTMSEFQTHDSNDYLEIIDGYYVEPRFLLASLNVSMPSTKVYQSTVNALTLRFKTNSENSANGFKAAADSLESSTSVPSITTVTSTSTVTTTDTLTTVQISTSTITDTSTVHHTAISTATLIRNHTSTVHQTQTETETVSQTVTSSVTQTETTTSIVPTTVTQTVISTKTQPLETPVPIRLLPSGTPLESMCCEVLNNVDYMSFTILQGVNDVMEKGMQYISQLIDKNASFVDRKEPVDPAPSIITDIFITPSRTIDTSPDTITSTVDINRNSISVSSVVLVPTVTAAKPADSCANISTGLSGDYLVKLGNGSDMARNVYCELEKEEYKGMARVVQLNMTVPDSECPVELKTVSTSGKKLCGRSTEASGCSSVFFNTLGLKYTKVCGRVIGYQYSSPNAFYWYDRNQRFTIDDVYVDGVVLTYSNNNKREHIWTFAAALDEFTRPNIPFGCECSNSGQAPATPGFMKNNYFCETGSRNLFAYNTYYMDDPLWDGKGCGPNSDCCDGNNGVFCTQLPETTSDIELRVCGNENLANEDTPLEIIELYVQ